MNTPHSSEPGWDESFSHSSLTDAFIDLAATHEAIASHLAAFAALPSKDFIKEFSIEDMNTLRELLVSQHEINDAVYQGIVDFMKRGRST